MPDSQPDLRQTVELSVERLGAQGDGIARFGSELVFLRFIRSWSPARLATAVFGPPRAGAARLAEALAASTLDTIVAVSCNPATFGHDAAKLIAGGYRLEQVTPIDQFLWTPHLELTAVFQR